MSHHPRVQRLTQISTMFYLAGLGVYLVLRSFVGESWSIVSLFNNFTHWYFVPAPFFMLAALLMRSKKTFRASLIPVVMLLVIYGPRYLPGDTPSLNAQDTHDSTAIHALTLNVWWRNTQNDSLIRTLMESQADIIALQEATAAVQAQLPDEFNVRYPYQYWRQGNTGADGAGFAARYPILDSSWALFAGRGHVQQRILLNVDGQLVVVYNVHLSAPRVFLQKLDYNPGLRTVQLAELISRAQAETVPVIIMGDFNLSDQAKDYGLMSSAFHDSFASAGTGMGLTWPSVQESMGFPMQIIPPLMRIDYIWHTEELRAVSSSTLYTSSDHRGLQSVLILEQP